MTEPWARPGFSWLANAIRDVATMFLGTSTVKVIA